MNISYTESHSIHFDIGRDEFWPDTLPWPEWKPVTTKTYYPENMHFIIGWVHGKDIMPPYPVTIKGRRNLQSGSKGSDVSCQYFGRDNLGKLHPAFQEILDAAIRVAERAKEDYEIRG